RAQHPRVRRGRGRRTVPAAGRGRRACAALLHAQPRPAHAGGARTAWMNVARSGCPGPCATHFLHPPAGARLAAMRVLPLRAPRVLPLLVTCACMPLAHADVRRCETPDGRTVYTDRACEDLGAVERVRRAAAGDGTPSQSLHRGQCSRTVEELAL